MFSKRIEAARTIAIGGHVRPDGDCTGSCMGMYNYLRENYPEKTVDVYLEEIPEAYKFLQGTKKIRHEIPRNMSYDLFLCLDCGDQGRLGFSAPLFEQAAHTFCIDHHISNQSFAEENHIKPEASSTSELVYHLLDEEKISVSTAEALYLGIVHDTGVFQYSCTAPSTMRAAARWKKGLMHRQSFRTLTMKKHTHRIRFSGVQCWKVFCSWMENVLHLIFARRRWNSMV